MDQQVARVLSRLTQACHNAVQDCPVETGVQVAGSALLKTALPALSDVDAVVILQPRAGDVNAGAYILELARENLYLQRMAMAMMVRE
jgi:tRNA nucleotidyltransferase (CCA-adding enzyme)